MVQSRQNMPVSLWEKIHACARKNGVTTPLNTSHKLDCKAISAWSHNKILDVAQMRTQSLATCVVHVCIVSLNLQANRKEPTV